jgi:hypothetical protein
VHPLHPHYDSIPLNHRHILLIPDFSPDITPYKPTKAVSQLDIHWVNHLTWPTAEHFNNKSPIELGRLPIVMQHHRPHGHGLTSKMKVSPKNYSVFLHLKNVPHEVDRKQLETSKPPVPSPCDHQEACNDCWKEYPRSLFPNWTASQVKKSKLILAIKNYQRDVACIIHHVDVDSNGYFRDAGKHFSTESTLKQSWEAIVKSQVSTIFPSYSIYHLVV